MKNIRKFVSWFGVFAVISAAPVVISQEELTEEQKNAPVVGEVISSEQTVPSAKAAAKAEFKSAAAGLLTPAQVDALITEWINDKTGAQVQFQAEFGARDNLTPQEVRKYAKSGKIPVRLTCELVEVKESGGKQLAKRVSGGAARFYILDSSGNVVDKKSLPMDRMCSAGGGAGGYCGEVAKEGEYTAVVWVEAGKNKVFGKKISASLSAVK